MTPEVRVQRLKVCHGMEKEQMPPHDLYQRGRRVPAFKCRAKTFRWGRAQQARGLPGGRGCRGWPCMVPGGPIWRGSRWGRGWERPVRAQRRREVGVGGREGADHPPPPAATGLSGQVPKGAAGGLEMGVRLCPAGNAGNRAVAWGSRGAGRRRRQGPLPAPEAAAARAAPQRLHSRPRRQAHPPR